MLLTNNAPNHPLQRAGTLLTVDEEDTNGLDLFPMTGNEMIFSPIRRQHSLQSLDAFNNDDETTSINSDEIERTVSSAMNKLLKTVESSSLEKVKVKPKKHKARKSSRQHSSQDTQEERNSVQVHQQNKKKQKFPICMALLRPEAIRGGKYCGNKLTDSECIKAERCRRHLRK